MNEKEMFISTWEREFATTLKVVRRLPEDKANFKPPGAKTRSAKELAEVFVGELGIVDMVVKGKIDFSGGMPKFSTYNEVLSHLEKDQAAMLQKVKGMSESDLNSKITAPVGPGKMAEVRRADMLWMMLMDSIHHRGQFSIYLRMVGAKVPSIYGPSGDEPWM
jgi:uncharacterized damage-inducible protein DinB